MPNESEPSGSIAVDYTSEFKRNIRQLSKKYRKIKTDVQSLIEQLIQGMIPGDRISGVQVEVYKARVRNSDTTKGKSGGYRIIYQRKSDGSILLVTIYSKTEQGDISAESIRQIILENDPAEEIVPEINLQKIESAETNPDSNNSSGDANSELSSPDNNES